MSSINPPVPATDNPPAHGAVTLGIPIRFDDFYRDRYARAVRLALVLTGSASGAEDLVQDVMTAAHLKWSRIASYDSPEAWLRRAIVNRAISRHRRMAVAAKGLLKLTATARTSVDLGESDWELWRRVRALPGRQAQIVALVYVEGLTLDGAAQVLGISLPTAKSHLARAKQRLEHDLSDWRNA